MSKLNKFTAKQKETVSKFLLDIAKIILTVFVIGGLVPGSPITGLHLSLASVNIVGLLVIAIWLIKEEKDVD